ncbi:MULTISPECIES: HD domain-containing phosphohydrolase [Methylomonas]|uniref:HD domain-containing phosphohydrolase n=1 Tax=Methylomonas TaxID=416 RepID=UPI0018D4C9C9|nr:MULTISPECIES: HD domain-containing phosphohydrolase [Methylomonas]
MAAEITLYHQERWDGSDYPDGLVGLAIPESAREALRSRFSGCLYCHPLANS